jgi:hypothetical protein
MCCSCGAKSNKGGRQMSCCERVTLRVKKMHSVQVCLAAPEASNPQMLPKPHTAPNCCLAEVTHAPEQELGYSFI